MSAKSHQDVNQDSNKHGNGDGEIEEMAVNAASTESELDSDLDPKAVVYSDSEGTNSNVEEVDERVEEEEEMESDQENRGTSSKRPNLGPNNKAPVFDLTARIDQILDPAGVAINQNQTTSNKALERDPDATDSDPEYHACPSLPRPLVPALAPPALAHGDYKKENP